MGESETERLEDQRRRALDIHRPVGALVTSEYLERKQEFVAVNRTDLEDILGFDGMAAFFSGLGMFCISGAGWLLIDKVMQQETFAITTPIGVCGTIVLAGLAFLGAGLFLHFKKRGRIERIFRETKPL